MTITYDFDDPAYFDVADMRGELDRVFDLCHGCRLCWDICPSFDTMFKAIDAKTDGIDVALPHADQDRIVDECYQCKLCYLKCPYIPPHEWQLDFPRLMLRAVGARSGGRAKTLGDKVLSATVASGMAGSVGAPLSNATLKPNSVVRKGFEAVFGIDAQRLLPEYNKERFSKWWQRVGRHEPTEEVAAKLSDTDAGGSAKAVPSFLEPTEDELAAERPGKEPAASESLPSFLEPTEDELAAQRPGHDPSAIVGTESSAEPAEPTERAEPAEPEAPSRELTFFPTCMIEYQDAAPGKAVVRVLKKNGCNVECSRGDRCCGMPSLDAGDIHGFVDKARRNVRELLPAAMSGRLIVIAEPTCNYVFRTEYPDYLKTADAEAVAAAIVDPAEYLVRLRNTEGINEDFSAELGTIAYHAACHQRAQQQGYRSRELLRLVPNTQVSVIEGCSGIDGTWGYRKANYGLAKQVIEPAAAKMREADADLWIGDCLLADVAFEEEGLTRPIHPMQALARAYGIPEDESTKP